MFRSSSFSSSTGAQSGNLASSALVGGASSQELSQLWRRALDVLEKVILLTFYTYFLIPIMEAVFVRGDTGAVLLAISETLVIALVFFRKPAQTLSQRPLDWVLAFGATLAPTLVRPVPGHALEAVVTFASLLMVAGILFQIVSKSMLGRRFGIVAANRGICASGPYRLVRHPIYMGYMMTHIGFLCISPSMWNLAMYLFTYSLMIPRIFAEERLLKRDPEYADYCQRVRSRLIPGVL